jgi:hypothetical protein
MDADSGRRPSPEILVTHLMEGIGISLDLEANRMFLTDLAGSIYSRTWTVGQAAHPDRARKSHRHRVQRAA